MDFALLEKEVGWIGSPGRQGDRKIKVRDLNLQCLIHYKIKKGTCMQISTGNEIIQRNYTFLAGSGGPPDTRIDELRIKVRA